MNGIFCMIGIVAPIVLLGVALARREQRSVDDDYQQLVKKSPWQPALRAGIASYGFFGLVIALSVVVFFMWPSTLFALLAAFSSSGDANRAVYMFGMVAVGFVLLLVVLVAEPYLRSSPTHQVRLRRFLQLAALLGGIAVVTWLLRMWALSSM